MYCVLNGSEIFSDSFFLQEAIVLLEKSKKSLINPEKSILNLYIETGSVKLSAIFSVAEWTKRNLLGFVYNVYIKLILYSDFYVCY